MLYKRKFCFRVLFFFVFLFLNFLISFSQDRQIRVVNLKVVADEEFSKDENWRLEIKRHVANASRVFEQNFGIGFEIGTIESWSSDNSENSIIDLLNNLRKRIALDEYDAVLGFTDQFRMEYGLGGVASYLKGYVLVRRMKSPVIMDRMIMHELGHLFGAIDLDQSGSIMSRRNQGPVFDAFSREIIRLNKNRNFNIYQFPLSDEKLDEAISLYNSRKEQNRGEVEIRILLASIYLEKKDYDAMMEECLQALKINPNLPDAYHHLGIAYRRKGQLDKAIVQYKKMLQIQPNLPEVHYNLGIAYMKKEEYGEAIREYDIAIELYPFYAKAYLNLGYVYLQQGLANRAIAECEKALELYPLLAEAYLTKGSALILKEQYTEAEAYSRTALGINPELSGAHNNLGTIYMNKNMKEQAIDAFEKSLQLNPEYTQAHYNLGRIYLLSGHIDEAIDKFKEAIRIRPHYLKAHSNLASAYLKKDMLEEAIQECEEVLDLGYAHLIKGRTDQAKKEAKRAISLDPKLPQPHNILGLLLEKEGRFDEALEEYQVAITLEPNHLEAHLNIGNLYMKKEVFPKALVHYKKVVDINPNHAQAHNNLAVIYYRQEMYEKAWAHIQKAEAAGLQVHPDFKQELKKKIK
jgi:tetratricopeptide (TPR) repeat protein